MKQRNITYDLMKGIAILLMMASHLALNVGMPKLMIYSFHMPLFFILAGVFAKDVVDITSLENFTRKNAKRLLLPYVITFFMLCAWGGIQAIAKHDVGFFIRPFLSMISATPDGYNSAWGLIDVGSLWFLVALFWVRELFYGINCVRMRVNKYGDELVVGVSIALSVTSVLIHPYMPALPFSFMQAFTASGFYAVGWYVYKHPMPWWMYGLCVIVWPIAFIYGEVDIACCKVNHYLLSFIGACGGTYVIFLVCKAWGWVLNTIHRTPDIISPLAWCGKYSLPFLCMHELEMRSGIYWSLRCRVPIDCECLCGGGIALLFAYILIKLPILKDVYK